MNSFGNAFGLEADQLVVGRSLGELVGEAASRATQPFADRALSGETTPGNSILRSGRTLAEGLPHDPRPQP